MNSVACRACSSVAIVSAALVVARQAALAIVSPEIVVTGAAYQAIVVKEWMTSFQLIEKISSNGVESLSLILCTPTKY